MNYTTVKFLFFKYALDIHIERKEGKLCLGCKMNQKDKHINIYVYLYLYWSVSSSIIWFYRSVHSVHKERDQCQHIYNLDLMFTCNIQGAKPLNLWCGLPFNLFWNRYCGSVIRIYLQACLELLFFSLNLYYGVLYPAMIHTIIALWNHVGKLVFSHLNPCFPLVREETHYKLQRYKNWV